ncbi:MAG: prepilin-type N-terminal cleavage/methylation domain-containing protein [Deltaproteobacteria bacterium]|nr:prepilin-type N-terminal cleavage/methylation domain-containing protein [Deltaproteobacteria bacterium]
MKSNVRAGLKGFTLVEALVTFAILAVIVTSFVAVFRSMVSGQRAVSGMGNEVEVTDLLRELIISRLGSICENEPQQFTVEYQDANFTVEVADQTNLPTMPAEAGTAFQEARDRCIAQSLITNLITVYLTDDDGNPKLDKDGNKIVIRSYVDFSSDNHFDFCLVLNPINASKPQSLFESATEQAVPVFVEVSYYYLNAYDGSSLICSNARENCSTCLSKVVYKLYWAWWTGKFKTEVDANGQEVTSKVYDYKIRRGFFNGP